MKSAMTASRQTQWIAGMVAVLGSLLTAGGPLMLADHYAKSGASWDASGYYAAEQARSNACRDNGKLSAEVVSPRRAAKNS
ncbi:MAG: hypothetical protein NTY41_15080 [Proteobacteria bacterium]|nr:hypothetical protein [Pseudomonadota bacterium]